MAKSLFEQIIDRSLTSLNETDLKGVSIIGVGTFRSCQSLQSVNIPDSVTVIDSSAFNGCTAITSVKMSPNTTEIGYSSFYGCNSITSIEIPSKVSTIGALAFAQPLATMKIADAYFYQPAGMTVTLPTAGNNYGMFYVKTARSMNIYTDNETIKNYAWSTDNITPTFYHLDGTAW